jgi:hypothetical protein
MNSVKNNEIWEQFYREGLDYLKTALNASNRPKVFTPVILYNISAMAIEKLFMGFLLYHKRLPENHTLEDLANEVTKVMPLSRKLKEKLLIMDSFQDICSIDQCGRKTLKEKDVRLFLSTALEVKIFTEKQLFK